MRPCPPDQSRAPSLELPVVRDLSQPLRLARGQGQVEFDADGMQEQGGPQGHAKGHAHGGGDFFESPAESGVDWHDAVVGGGGGGVGVGADGVLVGGSRPAHEMVDLAAGHGRVVVARLGDDDGGNDHDQAGGDDGAEVDPGPEHPGSVLVDLEPLDVVVGQREADGGHDGQRANAGLRGEVAAEGATGDHQAAHVPEEDENDGDAAVNPVEEYRTVPDGWDELQHPENAGWNDAAEMEGDTDPVMALSVPIPFARR